MGGAAGTRRDLGIGTGVPLIVLGAILELAVDGQHPLRRRPVLGTILIVAGVLTTVLVVVDAQRSRTRNVRETRYRQ